MSKNYKKILKKIHYPEDIRELDIESLISLSDEVRKEMIESAERLEFEKAAKIRDEIENIEKNLESVVL